MYFVSKIFLVVLFIYFAFFVAFTFFDSLYSDSENFLFYKGLVAFSTLDCFYNIDIVGQTLFNYFAGCFLVAGLILLISLVGAIVLAFDFAASRPTQQISSQLARTPRIL
jgi:NADH:ubiquinone oxidoreductase subunit 6 (subunit J)